MSDRSYTERTSLPVGVKRKFCRQLIAAVSLGKFSELQRQEKDREQQLASSWQREKGTHGPADGVDTNTGNALTVAAPADKQNLERDLRAAERLREYYLFWNPQKLEDPRFLHNVICVKYRGREEALYEDLATIYGPEPQQHATDHSESKPIEQSSKPEDAETDASANVQTDTPVAVETTDDADAAPVAATDIESVESVVTPLRHDLVCIYLCHFVGID